MARIEGTGIKTPSKKATRMAGKVASSMSGGSYGGYVDAGDARGFVSPEQAERMLKNPEAYKMRPSETRYLRESMGLPRAQADTDTFERRDFFSMTTDPRNEVKTASASGAFDESDFQNYLKAAGIRYPKQLPGPMMRGLRENYQLDKKEGYYKDGQIFNPSDKLLNKAPVEEKSSFIEKTKNLAGSIFNTVTGTQTATAGEMPSGTQFSPSGDTSFASYRMAGGAQQQQGSGIVTPFSQTSMGKGEPRNITKFQDTSMGRKPVSNLPSDYKQTEAREFAKAAAFQQAKKNPNVTVGVDSKGQPTATAVQRGRGESGGDNTAQGNQARVQQNAKARAQAAAFNRRMSGKSISQVKAANRQSMRESAAERQKAFKKTGKSTVGARRAAAKKRVQAAAKKRNAAFKARRKARTRRNRRSRSRGRGRGR
mgnify:CR=1 FL=1